MSVGTALKMWSRDSSETIVTGSTTQRIAIREAYSVTHSIDATPIEIWNAQGIPGANSVYPGTTFVLCNRAAPQRVSPIMSIVEVAYEGDYDANEPEIECSDIESEEPIDQDWNGNPIVTYNNEPIEGVTTTITDPTLTVRRKFLSFSQYTTAAYRRATNSDTFFGWPAGTARLTNFNAKLMGSLTTGYWDVTATIQFRFPFNTTSDKAWYARVRHEGYYEKSGSNIIRALDSNGEPTVRPVLLKSDGTRETNSTNAIWLEWQRYGSLPYNALGLL